jgi:hypothetical protein
MRYSVGLMGLLLLSAFPAFAQSPSSDEFMKQIQHSFRTAKNPDEVESIKMYCRARIGSLSFRERDQLTVRAIKLMEANEIDQANVLLKRVNSLEELDANLSAMICKPR